MNDGYRSTRSTVMDSRGLGNSQIDDFIIGVWKVGDGAVIVWKLEDKKKYHSGRNPRWRASCPVR